MSHDHDWLDITTVMDIEHKYVCSGCDARKTGGTVIPGRTGLDDLSDEMAERDARLVQEALDAPKNDGWDGMRRFLRQMSPDGEAGSD